jgi:phage tail protein X
LNHFEWFGFTEAALAELVEANHGLAIDLPTLATQLA